MQKQIQQLLSPIRRRMTRARSLPRIATALLLGGWLALVAALLTLFGGSFTSGLIGIVVAALFPIVAVGWSLLRPARWKEAAQLVDRRLHLHDRVATALSLSQNVDGDPFTELQLDDALTKLRTANINQIQLVVPWERLARGLVLTLLAIGLIIWGIVAPPAAAIQTSGDMQDLRPEITPRQIVADDIARESLAESWQFEPEATTNSASNWQDVAGPYFDVLDENANR